MFYLSIKQRGRYILLLQFTDKDEWSLECLNTSLKSPNFRFLEMNLNPDLSYFSALVFSCGAKMSSKINF